MKFDRYLYDRKEKKEKLFTFMRRGVGQADGLRGWWWRWWAKAKVSATHTVLP
ncbi:hypothetical protein [Undibacterium sp. WLX3042]|uniref:hypothetical protein n=1 Tax=Undibacterium sp. WLX3042 TaxID=3412686 RepID=UPI003C2AF569